MEVKIYADVLFAISSLMVFTAYGATALLCGIKASVIRVTFGSFVISLISTVLTLYFRRFVNPACIFALAMLGTYLCLNVTDIKRNIKYSLLSLLCGALIGGVKIALSETGLINDTAAGLVLTAAVLYAGFFTVLKKVRAVTVKKQRLCRLTVCRGDIKAELTALVDTGNELRGSNHESVIIAERQAAGCLFEEADTALRLLPYKSIGSGDGVLVGVLCDYALIDGVKTEKVIVAAVDGTIGGGAYNALINPETEVI